jgi:hypothetical protein
MNIVREHINEKFTQDSDPIDDLGIGTRHLVEKWLKKYNIVHYQINDDLTINVNGEVNLSTSRLSGSLPKYIKFNIVDGKFNISNNKITSLKGCPKIVKSNFECMYTDIKNLKYSPIEVNGSYLCSYMHNLQSLEGLSQKISNGFYCRHHHNHKIFSKEDIPSNCKITGTLFFN